MTRSSTVPPDPAPDVDLALATVSRLEPIGLGDRACIDLVELLAPGEGALLGSFARGLFLVHSECLSSEYIRARPFRVNAGAIHSYVMRSEDKTGYLSELASGQEVERSQGWRRGDARCFNAPMLVLLSLFPSPRFRSLAPPASLDLVSSAA